MLVKSPYVTVLEHIKNKDRLEQAGEQGDGIVKPTLKPIITPDEKAKETMPSLDSTEQAATSEEQRLSEFLGEGEHAPNVGDDSNSMHF